MKTYTIAVLTALLFVSTNTYSVEITPLFGYRTGGEFIDKTTNKEHNIDSSESYGVIIGFPYEYGKNIEIYYSHQSSDLSSLSFAQTTTTSTVNIPLTIDYLHVGGTAPISDNEKLKTFVSGGLGFTYMSPDFPDTQSDLRASFSIGIGLKWPITDNVALRLETRALATLFNSNSAIFCNGGCSIAVSGNLFLQGEVFAGLAIKF